MSFYFFIDVVNACNCNCRGCARRNHPTKRSEMAYMKPELLSQILQKACGELDEQPIVGLYNWSEPFLHNQIDQMVRVTKRHNAQCIISSNFSVKIEDTLKATLDAWLDRLIVSVSGFDQETHSKYHIGGNLSLVKSNLDRLALLKDAYPQLTADVHYITFDYNQGQVDQFEQYCKERKLGFLTKPDATWIDVSDSEYTLDDWPEDFVPYSAIGRCPHTESVITMDWKGDVYLCCFFWYRPEYLIGNFLNAPLEDFNNRKKIHPRCIPCQGPWG